MHKLSKTAKVGSNSSLYSDRKKLKTFKQKNIYIKITKGAHAFKGNVISYNVEILNSLTSELQLKNHEPTIKSKFIDLLTPLKAFKFVTNTKNLFWCLRR